MNGGKCDRVPVIECDDSVEIGKLVERERYRERFGFECDFDIRRIDIRFGVGQSGIRAGDDANEDTIDGRFGSRLPLEEIALRPRQDLVTRFKTDRFFQQNRAGIHGERTGPIGPIL